MDFNFELILFYALALSGTIALLDVLYFAPKRKKQQSKNNASHSGLCTFIFSNITACFFERSFAYQPFRIPSGSLEPTLDDFDVVVPAGNIL